MSSGSRAASPRPCATAVSSCAVDRDFEAVIEACAAPRARSLGTWITPEMNDAYVELHRLRLRSQHRMPARIGKLVGGLYGVRLGGVFFGESMFALERDASKVALAHLVDLSLAEGIVVIDCQMASRHLESLGSRQIPRVRFQALLREHTLPAKGMVER